MLTAAVLSPSTGLPVAKYDHPWDGRLARARVLDWCKSKVGASPTTKEIEAGCARRAFLIKRDGEPDYTREAWDLPYADVLDGILTIIPRGVKALASGHGVMAIDDISEGDRNTLKRHTCALYAKVRAKHVQMPPCPFEDRVVPKEKPVTSALPMRDGDAPADEAGIKSKICALYRQLEQECPFEDEEPESEEAAAEPACDCAKEKPAPMYASGYSYSRTAAGVPVLRRAAPLEPPIEWFAPQETSGPVPLTISADGRVTGHGALWDSCHAGYMDRCVPVPHSAQDYRFFHRGAVKTSDGSLVAVGHLTVGAGHADDQGNLVAASEHYDDAGTTVAVVSAHEDRWGIFLAGAAVPEATPQQIAMLLRSPLSGDWREFNGNLELVAMHGVNVPGFGVDRPRVAVAASGVLIFPGPYAEVEEAKVSQEEIDKRISLAASILIGQKGA